MQTLTIAAGTARDFDRQAVRAADGLPAEGMFRPTDALACTVWPGDDRAALATPSVAWIDPDAASFRIAFQAADTADLEARTYRLRVTATRAGREATLFDAWLQVDDAPGLAVSPLTWCGYDDMRAAADWIDKLQSPDSATGFETQRARATQWAIETAMARLRDTLDDQSRRHATASPLPYTAPSSGIDLGPGWGRSTYPCPDVASSTDDFRTLLNTPDAVVLEARLVDAVARMAIHHACAGQLGEQAKTSYQELASRYRAQAIQLLTGVTFRVLTPDDDDHPERWIEG